MRSDINRWRLPGQQVDQQTDQQPDQQPEMTRSWRRSWRAGLVLLGGVVLSGNPALADSVMRCDSFVVSRGLTFIEVLERCGAPDAQFARLDLRVAGVYLPVEEWIYELGRNRFRRLLTFENGRLARIEQRPKPVLSIRQLTAEQ